MSDTIKLVIEMPKEDYEFTKGARTARFFSEEYYVKLILNGTPLDDVLDKIEPRQRRVTDDKTPPYTPYVGCGFGGE